VYDVQLYIRQFDLTNSSSYVEMLQTGLKRLGEWAVENVMIVNQTKSEAVTFTRD
jgi:hypothetical protein